MTELGQRIRAERIRTGLSQTALAGEDFSPSYVSLIEAGKRVPTDSALAVLAQRLDTTADYLRYGDKAPSEERARLEIGYARIALANGAPQEARDRLLALDLGAIAPRHHQDALHALAMAHEALGDLDESIAVLEPLLAAARRDRRSLDAARLATDLVASYHEAGDLGHSIELGEAVLAELEEQGIAGSDEHLRLAATVLWSYYERGDLVFATHRAAELLRLADDRGTHRGRGSIYWNASLVAEGRGDLSEARRLTERALAYLADGAVSRDLPRLRLHYGWLLIRSDPPEPGAALEQLELAMRDLDSVGSVQDIARCQVEQGRAHLLLGDPMRAVDLARGALERLDGDAMLDACHAHILLGDALMVLEQPEEARASYQWAADRLGMMAANRNSAEVWRTLGDRMLAHGDLHAAIHAYDRALSEVGLRRTAAPATSVSHVTTTEVRPS